VFVTASPAEDAAPVDWSAVARVPSVVILMGGASIARITERLLANGVPPTRPAVAIEWGTTARQRVVESTLASLARDVAAARLGAPVTIVVGEVAALASRYRWYVPGSYAATITPSPSSRGRRARPIARRPRRRAPARSRTRGTTSASRGAALRGDR